MQDGNKPQDEAPWRYNAQTNDGSLVPVSDTYQTTKDEEEESFSWTASEYLDHERDMRWYAMLAGGAVAVALITYLVSRDWISTGVVCVAALTLGIFAARKPRVLKYELTEQGVRVAGKPYSYNLFRSFTIHQESGVPSVELMPLRRFMTPLTIYFDPKDADMIIDVIAHFLPHEQRDPAMVDRVMHRLRF